jgi:hypothetical protein
MVRGRKSAASQTLIAASTDVDPRPTPPETLTDEEACEWIAIVNSLPADYFAKPAQATLAQFCRHVIIARRLAELIRACGKKFDARYRTLLREHRAETATVMALLRSMRLTILSIKGPSRAPIPASSFPKPWES